MIRACLFDMGKVLVEFSHDQMLRQMADVCGCTGEELRAYLMDSGRLLQYERGVIDEAELHYLLETQFERPIDAEALQRAASDIFTEKTEMLPLLEELRELGLRLVLLSNTSRAHFEFIRARFSFLDYFDACVLSYEVRALKPEPEIYHAAVQAAGQPPAHCFFTDDIAENVRAARACGLQAEQFFNRDQLLLVLRRLQLPLRTGL